ncbi:ATP dependent DNA ligase [Bradyrhizobium sp. USDA 3364]
MGTVAAHNLVYMGKVGTGRNRTTSSKISKALDSVVSPKSKLSKPLRRSKATWVDPVLQRRSNTADITSEGLLRASSFKGVSRK